MQAATIPCCKSQATRDGSSTQAPASADALTPEQAYPRLAATLLRAEQYTLKLTREQCENACKALPVKLRQERYLLLLLCLSRRDGHARVGNDYLKKELKCAVSTVERLNAWLRTTNYFEVRCERRRAGSNLVSNVYTPNLAALGLSGSTDHDPSKRGETIPQNAGCISDLGSGISSPSLSDQGSRTASVLPRVPAREEAPLAPLRSAKPERPRPAPPPIPDRPKPPRAASRAAREGGVKLPEDVAASLDALGVLDALQRPLSEPASVAEPEVAVEAARRLAARMKAGYRPTRPSGLFVTIREEVRAGRGERAALRAPYLRAPASELSPDELRKVRAELRALSGLEGAKLAAVREMLSEVDQALGIGPPPRRTASPQPPAITPAVRKPPSKPLAPEILRVLTEVSHG